MGLGAVFILLIVVIVVGGIAAALWAVRAGLWVRETSTRGDTAESGGASGDAAGEAGEERRPEHTTVDDPGNQTYVGR